MQSNDDKYIAVKNSNHLERDCYSGAIINNDSTGYRNAINAHKRSKEKELRLETLESDINIMKNDIALLVELLKDKV